MLVQTLNFKRNRGITLKVFDTITEEEQVHIKLTYIPSKTLFLVEGWAGPPEYNYIHHPIFRDAVQGFGGVLFQDGDYVKIFVSQGGLNPI